MTKKYQNAKHLAWIRTLPCLIEKAGYYAHNGDIQAHHLMKPYDGVRGMSLKSNDRNVIPLCQFHHQELHTKYGNEFAFFKAYGLPETFGQTTAKTYFETMQDLKPPAKENNDLPF